MAKDNKLYDDMAERICRAVSQDVPPGTLLHPGRTMNAVALGVVSTLGSFGVNRGPEMALLCMAFLHEFHRAVERLAVNSALDEAVDEKGATKQ